MNTLFDSSFFVGNRERLRELFTGTAPIVITANGLLQRNNDSSFNFRQDSTFWYLTGLDDPDLILVMDKGKEYLIVPGRDMSREAFDGRIDNRGLAERSGVAEALDEKTGWKTLNTRLSKVKHVATVAASPPYVDGHGLYTNPSRARMMSRIKAMNPDVELLDLRAHIVRMRSQKQSVEVDAIREAIQITSDTLKRLKRKGFSKYEHEYEVEADITAGFRKAGGLHAYTPIVASGGNACTLHYNTNNESIDKSGLLLLDVGAEVSLYASDITRTYAVTDPTKRQSKVWESVVDAQNYALSLLKPGVILREYEGKMEHYVGEKLRELGLVKTINHDNVRKYFPHGTSHFLGLDVHDAGEYEKPLLPGMVITVEPGIYIPEEQIGVRIEDDVLITEQGVEVLSASLPRELV